MVSETSDPVPGLILVMVKTPLGSLSLAKMPSVPKLISVSVIEAYSAEVQSVDWAALEMRTSSIVPSNVRLVAPAKFPMCRSFDESSSAASGNDSEDDDDDDDDDVDDSEDDDDVVEVFRSLLLWLRQNDPEEVRLDVKGSVYTCT